MNSQVNFNNQIIKRLLLLLLLTPLALLSFGQAVGNGGGKISVDITTGDPGGPDGDSGLLPQLCFQVGTCDTLELEGFTITNLMFREAEDMTNATFGTIPGISFRVLGMSGNDQLVEVCIDDQAYTGPAELVLINSPLTNAGNNGGSPTFVTESWKIRVCLSINCPYCTYRPRPVEQHQGGRN